MNIEELIGSLQTYELTLLQPKKNKSIAFKSSKEEVVSKQDDEQFDLIVKHFIKLFKSRGGQRKFNQGTEKTRGRSKNYKKEKKR